MDEATERRYIEEIDARIASGLRLIERMNLCIAMAEAHGLDSSHARRAVQLMHESVAALRVTRRHAEDLLQHLTARKR